METLDYLLCCWHFDREKNLQRRKSIFLLSEQISQTLLMPFDDYAYLSH